MSTELLRSEAMTKFHKGDIENACRLYADLVKQTDSNPQDRLIYGSLLQRINRYDDAVIQFEILVNNQPGMPEAHASLGSVLANSGKISEAIGYFRNAVHLAPDTVENWANLGMALSHQNNKREAIHCFSKAIALDPKKPGLYLARGLAEGIHDPGIAAVSFRKAVELDPSSCPAHINLASALVNQGILDEAIEHLKQAVALNPAASYTRYSLALVCDRAHRTDEAETAVDHALELDKNNVDAHGLKIRLLRLRGELKTAIEHIDALLARNPDRFESQRIRGEQGKVLEKLGKYDASFKTYERAQFLASQSIEAQKNKPDHYLNNITLRRTWMPGDNFNLRPGQAQPSEKSPSFLVGHPRSGTTLTEQILESHPGIVASGEQTLLPELEFLACKLTGKRELYPDVINQLSDEQAALLANEYWKHAGKKRAEDVTCKHYLDKLPLNILRIAFINRIFPDARIIVALRDPRDVCLSSFVNLFKLNPSMACFLTLEGTARHYAQVMDLWLHYKRNLSNIHFLEFRYEDLVADIEAKARTLLDFVGEPWDPIVLNYFQEVKKRNVSTPSLEGVVQPIYSSSIGRWRHFEKHMEPVIPILQPYLDEFGYSGT